MKTLVEQLRRNLEADPGDAPAVQLQDAIDLDRMWREAPTAQEERRGAVMTQVAPPTTAASAQQAAQ